MAGSDKETRRVDAGRNSDQPSNSVSEAASGKTKQQLKEQDAEWGFEPGKSGMATEAKMGMGIIVILVCAFGFLVYHKFELRQRQLLAAKVSGPASEEIGDLQKAVSEQANAFNEFTGQAQQTAANTELLPTDLNLREPGNGDLLAGETQNVSAQIDAAANAATDSDGSPDEFGSGGEAFASLDDVQENPLDVLLGNNQTQQTEVQHPFDVFDKGSQPQAETLPESPFDTTGFDTATTQPTPFQRTPTEPIPQPDIPADEPDLFADSSPAAADLFPAFNEASSAAVALEPEELPAATDVATTNPFDSFDPSAAEVTASTEVREPDFDSAIAENSAEPNEIAGFDRPPTTIRDLPTTDEVGSLATTARSVSQSSQLADLASTPDRSAKPKLLESQDRGTLLPAADLFDKPLAAADTPKPNHNFPSFDQTPVRETPGRSFPRQDETAQQKQDLHNVIAMLGSGPDVNLFEDPTERPSRPPRTFPSETASSIPEVAEPEMPQFGGFENGPSAKTPASVVERFPTPDATPQQSSTFDSPNLFEEPIAPPTPSVTPEPPVANDGFSSRTQLQPAIEFDPVPQPADPRPVLTQPTPALRPYEPVPEPTLAQPPLILGPDDGVAHIVDSLTVRQASGSYEHKEICTVQNKDTYWTISKRIYGTPRYFSSLALYNQHRIPDPRKLRPGMKVLVPAPGVLEAKYPEFFQKAKAKTRTQPKGFFLTKDHKPAYRVGEHETLGAISQKHLGRASRWIQIYQMNRQILKDPNKLKPGTVISLPDDATNVRLNP